MRIVSVDNEKMAVEYMERLLQQVEPGAEFCGFTTAQEALAYLDSSPVDVALLDIEMGQYSGLELAKACKERCPEINIIFVTGYSQYAMEAMQLHASGYLMKPVRAEALRGELDHLRNPLPTVYTCQHRVRIQTFGNFEVFLDGEPLRFPLSKCKECLAYLVDRKGALVTVPELANMLWEDRPFDRALRNSTHQVVFALIKTLKAHGVADVVVKHARELAINPAKVDCDYFQLLSGDQLQLNRFAGEYMKNYSWAEFTVGGLLQRQHPVE